MAAPDNYKKLGTVGTAYKGDYDPSQDYKYANTVYFEGSTYIALKDSPIGEPTDDGVNWKYFARGASGSGSVTSVNGKDGDVKLSASDVSAIPETDKGSPDGVASLDATGKVPKIQLPEDIRTEEVYVGEEEPIGYNRPDIWIDSTEESAILNYLDPKTNEYKQIGTGRYNKNDIDGIQKILNAHKENDLLEIGDEIGITLTDGVEMIYQIGGINIFDSHDVVFVPKWLYPELHRMNASSTNAGGFANMELYSWLQNDLFNKFPNKVKILMVNTTQMISVGNRSTETKQTIGKIFLPTEWEIFGSTIYSSPNEHTVGNTVQWPIFVIASNRIKTIGKNGNNYQYWECSPSINGENVFCDVLTNGIANGARGVTNELGVLPCFRIKAQM